MNREIKISVGSLVEYVVRSGDLTYEFQGTTRAMEGIWAHQALQRARPDNYLPEVPVSFQVTVDEFNLKIGGRIDGVYLPGETDNEFLPVVEEIKTTKKSLDSIGRNPLHWAQLKCYAFLYAAEKNLDRIDTRLTYYQIEQKEVRSFDQRLSLDELTLFFQELLDQYIEWVRIVLQWIQCRDQSIQSLDFPFNSYRPGQREMAVHVYRTIRSGNQMIFQAATGIGKTMAAVFPAIKAFPEGYHSKIFYLAARTTGKKISESAIQELRTRGLKLKSLTLTAKDKICFHPGNACNGDECEYAKGYYDRINPAIRFLFKQDSLTREAVEDAAREFKVCPFEFSLEISRWVDCIICDYNYAFDPRAYLRRFFSDDPDHYTFLIDEAHNLVDRAREMFSAEIEKQPFLDLRRAIRDELPEIYRSMGKINTWLVGARKKCQELGMILAEKNAPDQLYPYLRKFIQLTEHWLSLNKKRPFLNELMDLYFKAIGFLRVAEQYTDAYSTIYEQIKKNLKLKLFCIDPSGSLKEALKRSRSAVFFSATMTPAEYFKKILGCNIHSKHIVIPSPFSRRNLGIFIADHVSTYFKEREKTALAVARTIESFVTQKRGNYLIFFPSYQYLDLIYPILCKDAVNVDLICQRSEMTEHERHEFLDRFSRNNTSTLVGLAVMGGVFGEGIDLVGDRLSGAAVVGVGLPGISLERELIRKFFAEIDGAGFEFAYLYPGINRVLQAAGRVIRSDTDRGVVLLIDQRFSRRQYNSLLPREWDPFRFHCPDRLIMGLEKFWNR